MSTKKSQINFYERPAMMIDMEGFDHLSKKGDFIEVTEWKNGEGWDIAIGDNPIISLTDGQFRAIKKLIKKLNKKFEK